MYRRFVVLVFIILSSLFILGISVTQAAEDYALFTNEFYSNNYIITTTKPGDSGMRELGTNDKLTVTAAKNEIQSASFAVYNSSEKNLQNFNISVSDLKKGSDVVSLSQITVYVVKVMEQRNSLRSNGGHTSIVPEFLVPQSPAYKDRNEWDIGQNKSKQFWLDIEVPATAQAGVYTGTITIQPENGVTKTIPLQLTVHNFILQKSSQKVNGLFFTPQLSILDCIRVNPCVKINQIDEAGGYQQYVHKQFALLSKYGVQLIESQAKPTFRWVGDNVEINWDRYRAELQEAKNFGLNKKPIPYIGAFYDTPKKLRDLIREHNPSTSDSQIDDLYAGAYRRVLTEAVDIAKNDYNTDIVFYLIDEPFLNPDNIKDRERLKEQATELKRLLPTAKTWGTISFDNWWGFYNDYKQYFNYLVFDARVDDWKTKFASINAFQAALEKDQKYKHIGQMYFNAIEPANISGHRIKHGLFLWMLPLEANIPWTYQNIIGDPFNDLDQSSDYPNINLGDTAGKHGDRMMAYPDFFNGMTPMPAMQLVGLREGSTDLSYIETLQNAMELSSKTAVKTQAEDYLVKLRNNLIRSGDVEEIQNDYSPSELDRFRSIVADYIEQLDVTLPLPSPTPVLSLQGDINGDEKVDLVDYYYLVSALSHGQVPSSVNPDVNGDGTVDQEDRTIIVNILKQEI